MHKALNGKGYIKEGEGVFITGAGEVYAYRDGELAPMTVTDGHKGVAHLKAAGLPEPGGTRKDQRNQ